MTSLLNFFVVALAGAFGAISRYGITIIACSIPGGSSLWGTAFANILGCALLGGLVEYTVVEGNLPARLILALRVGFLGSLTTFSTFAAEAAGLAGLGRGMAASGFVLANLILGWAALMLAANWVKGWIS